MKRRGDLNYKQMRSNRPEAKSGLFDLGKDEAGSKFEEDTVGNIYVNGKKIELGESEPITKEEFTNFLESENSAFDAVMDFLVNETNFINSENSKKLLDKIQASYDAISDSDIENLGDQNQQRYRNLIDVLLEASLQLRFAVQTQQSFKKAQSHKNKLVLNKTQRKNIEKALRNLEKVVGEFYKEIKALPVDPRKDAVDTGEKFGPREQKEFVFNAIDASDIVEMHARIAGDRELNRRLNEAKWYSKWFYVSTEEGYRQRYIKEERKKILETGRLSTGENLNDEGSQERNAILERFANGYLRSRVDELKTRIGKSKEKNPQARAEEEAIHSQIQSELNNLVVGYARRDKFEDEDIEEFQRDKRALFASLSKRFGTKIGESLDIGIDDFAERTKELHQYYKHGQNLANVDVRLHFDLGVVKRALHNKVNESWIDQKMGELQKSKFGALVNPVSVGFGLSIGAWLARKPVAALGLGALGGGLFAAFRRQRQLRFDRAMVAIEKGMGLKEEDYDPTVKVRTILAALRHLRPEAIQDELDRLMKGEGATLERRSELLDKIPDQLEMSVLRSCMTDLTQEFEKNPTKDNAIMLLQLVTQAEARQSYGEVNNEVLVSFDEKGGENLGLLQLQALISTTKVRLQKPDALKALLDLASEPGVGGEMEDALKIVGEMHYRLTKGWFVELSRKIDQANFKFENYEQVERLKAFGMGAVFAYAGGKVGEHVAHWINGYLGDTWMSKLMFWHKGESKTAAAIKLVEDHRVSIRSIQDGKFQGNFKVPAGTHMERYDSGPLAGALALKDNSGNVLVDKIFIDRNTGEVVTAESTGRGGYIIKPRIVGKEFELPQSAPDWVRSVAGEERGVTINHKTWLESPNARRLAFGMGGKGYDKNGDLHLSLANFIDPKRGVDIDKLIADDKLVMHFTPDGAFSKEAVELSIDPRTREVVIPKGSPFLNELFSKDHPPKFLGKLWEVGCKKDNGFEVWSSVTGLGKGDLGGGAPTELEYQIIPKSNSTIDQELTFPFLGFLSGSIRKPLEPWRKEPVNVQEKEDYAVASQENYANIHPNNLESDKFAYNEGYPFETLWKSADLVASELLERKDFNLLKEEAWYKRPMLSSQRSEYLAERIRAQRLEILNSEYAQVLVEYLPKIQKELSVVLSKYTGKDVSIPNFMDKTYMLGAYDWMHKNGDSLSSAMASFDPASGEVYLNADSILKFQPDKELFIKLIVKSLLHEYTHKLTVKNYWMKDTGDDNWGYDYNRRFGLSLTRRRSKKFAGRGSESKYYNRGNELNEAVTETLSAEVFGNIFPESREGIEGLMTYGSERHILRLLDERLSREAKLSYGSFYDLLVKAMIDRRSLGPLLRSIRGREETVSEVVDGAKVFHRVHNRAHFFELILNFMAYEKARNSATNYPLTQDLIGGKKVRVRHHRGLLDNLPTSIIGDNWRARYLQREYNLQF